MADSDSSTADARGRRGFDYRAFLRFAIPSLLGVLAFLTPIVDDGEITIGLAILSNALAALLEGWLGTIAGVVLSVSAVLTVGVSLTRRMPDAPGLFDQLFNVGIGYALLRVVGAIFALMTLFGVGPEFVISENTGQVVLFDVITALVAFFFFASFLLPLLTDFGGMEFVGTLLHGFFRKVLETR